MYNISTSENAIASLQRILQVDDIKQEWYLCDLNNEEVPHKFKKQIEKWDLTKEEFLVNHVTSSVNELSDIYKYGLLSLYDVLNTETTLNNELRKRKILFDIQNNMLNVMGNFHDLDEKRRGYYDENLDQIHRAIHNDYLSTMLYEKDPWFYGSYLFKRPEFMIYLELVNKDCKEFVEWWWNNSTGYKITAKVPFEDVQFETFGIFRKEDFIYDSNHGYLQSKKHLIYQALKVVFSNSIGSYLFIDKGKKIKPEQFIGIEKYEEK